MSEERSTELEDTEAHVKTTENDNETVVDDGGAPVAPDADDADDAEGHYKYDNDNETVIDEGGAPE